MCLLSSSTSTLKPHCHCTVISPLTVLSNNHPISALRLASFPSPPPPSLPLVLLIISRSEF